MAKKMSKAGQALLDDVLAVKEGSAAKIWTADQLLAISVRKKEPADT